MDGFGIKTERAYDQSLKNFETFLGQSFKEGSVPVLLLDEAQNLNRDCLKLVHYLLNYETDTIKLLQVILVGQEERIPSITRGAAHPEVSRQDPPRRS
jgi:type II secretory pathway predicted ATPase ExeA